METGQDRRRNPRKKVHLPVKIIIDNKVVAHGYVVDMSYSGVKIDTLLKISKGETPVKDLLATNHVVLELGNPTGNRMQITASAGVKWHTYSCGETNEIYMAGMELMLASPEKQEWQQTYERV